MKIPAILALLFLCFYSNAQPPVPVILDTDVRGDCDDAGALAVLNALADLGEAEIIAVVTNLKEPSNSTAGAVDAINTYYGRPDIPIGTYKGQPLLRRPKPSPFSRDLKDHFPNDASFNDQTAVLIAVRGPDPELWHLSPPGNVVVDSEGNTAWETSEFGRHFFVSIRPHSHRLEKIIGSLMSAPPGNAERVTNHHKR